MQQVREVGVQRGQPVLVTEFAAQGECLGGEAERLTGASRVGQQPGQVVERRDCGAAVGQPPGLIQAFAEAFLGGAVVGGEAAERQ